MTPGAPGCVTVARDEVGRYLKANRLALHDLVEGGRKCGEEVKRTYYMSYWPSG
jgi:hypothetical protein